MVNQGDFEIEYANCKTCRLNQKALVFGIFRIEVILRYIPVLIGSFSKRMPPFTFHKCAFLFTDDAQNKKIESGENKKLIYRNRYGGRYAFNLYISMHVLNFNLVQ